MKRITFFFLFCAIFPAPITAGSAWRQIALNGVEVTALRRGVGPDRMIVGTAGQGVYRYRNVTAEPIVSGNFAIDSLLKRRTVHCLEVVLTGPMKGSMIAAGTDSGLYIYMSVAGSPRWEAVPEVPRTNIRALLFHYTSLRGVLTPILFIATDGEVYRMNSGGNPPDFFVDTLRIADALPLSAKSACIRCLASPHALDSTIYCGSVRNESNSSWTGILRSEDNGKTWKQFNEGWKDGRAPGIRSLAVYYPIFSSPKPEFLAAADYSPGSGNDCFKRTDENSSWDTIGILRNQGMQSVYMTYYTNSELAMKHVAGEGGVFRDSGGPWAATLARLGDLTKVNALQANDEGESDGIYDSLYAGTKNGLYLYCDKDTRMERNGPASLNGGYEKPVFSVIPMGTARKHSRIPNILSGHPLVAFTLQGRCLHPDGMVRDGNMKDAPNFSGNASAFFIFRRDR